MNKIRHLKNVLIAGTLIPALAFLYFEVSAQVHPDCYVYCEPSNIYHCQLTGPQGAITMCYFMRVCGSEELPPGGG